MEETNSNEKREINLKLQQIFDSLQYLNKLEHIRIGYIINNLNELLMEPLSALTNLRSLHIQVGTNSKHSN